ncbi:MAG: D-tyrosyl-tRNA(Tyr) deacylase [Candidatus Accumulibacter meliphilus]|jgi:D-tyrosyl-tRNA(Tyr) deacylase|uniref:D-aminoacyl-tRNA deacylase n=1 Tax=Candidatus Accumulibacter meliphilus TaxID=2211374 RepID=A0A369XL51_9PROT|nr:MAG: D-tyrosyl-tRNA(Tyr) deacylase [Candidatus Accumulibacter meliphilus]
MRVVAQRVASARVEVDGQVTGSIGAGLLVLAGFEPSDADADLDWMAAKLARLRIFADAAGVMNRSVVDADGEMLAVSQFTLFASTRKGNRPSWNRAAPPDLAQPLFESFVLCLEKTLGRQVPTGVFGADMQVHLINDGPVTISLDSRQAE